MKTIRSFMDIRIAKGSMTRDRGVGADRIEMEQRRKKLHQITALLGIVICLTGCASEKTEKEPWKRDGSSPTRSSESVNENIQADPEVVGYPTDGLVGVYRGELIQFYMEDLERFLESIDDSVLEHEYIVNEISCSEIDEGTCASGAEYSVVRHTEAFLDSVLYYDNKEACRYYHAYAVYYGEWNFGKNSYSPGDAMFLAHKDFAFATAEEAEQAVRDALDTLGLGKLVRNRILCVDHEGMRELGKRLSTDEMFAPMKGEPVENNGYPVKEDWSEADDCYIFSFGTGVEATAMSYHFEDRETYNYIPCEIIVVYGAEGILFLRIDSPWRVGACIQEPQKLIPPEEILSEVEILYQNTLTYEGVSIEKIQLEYQYLQKKDTYELFPVWRVTISRNDPYGHAPIYEYTQYHALTGDEL